MYGIVLLDELHYFRRTAQNLLKNQKNSYAMQYAGKRNLYYVFQKMNLKAKLNFSSLYLRNQ